MDKTASQDFICVILFVCILGITPSKMTYYATEIDGQYTVTLSFPRDCCEVNDCKIYKLKYTSIGINFAVFARISSLGSELGTNTSLKATFPLGNDASLFLKIGPVDKNTFRNDYAGEYSLESDSENCPNKRYYVEGFNSMKKLFSDISEKLNDKNVTETDIHGFLDTLERETGSTDFIEYNDLISVVVDILAQIGNVTKVSKDKFSSAESLTDKFLGVTNNIINENNTDTWDNIQRKKDYGAENLIKTVEAWTEKVSNVLTAKTPAMVLSKENLYFQMESVVDKSDIEFPNSQTNYTMDWMKQRMNQIVFPKLNDSLRNGKLPTAYSAMVYRNMSKLVARSLTKDEVNSAIVSFSVYPHTTVKLDPPVSLTLQVINKKLVNPQCSFLDKSNRSGEFTRWSQEGCVTMPYKVTDDGVVCQCNHLTNFALLMSPVPHIEHPTTHVVVIISFVGCSISIVCLFVTLAVYLFFWKKIRDNRTIILINLFGMLLSAYIVFLAGVKTTNQAACTAVSVSLHFLLSLVFLLMLAEGIDLVLVIIRPLLRKRDYGIYFVIASYVSGAIIVGVTVAASQLEGYGSDKYCWLSAESGLVWVFLGEVILVIAINSVLMVIVLKKMLTSSSIGTTTKKVDGKLWVYTYLYAIAFVKKRSEKPLHNGVKDFDTNVLPKTILNKYHLSRQRPFTCRNANIVHVVNH